MENTIRNNIKPDWNLIEQAIEECSKFLKSKNFKEEIIDAISLVIGELIENAIKYGNTNNQETSISYSVSIDNNDIIVEVKNRINEISDKNLKRLDRTIQWIRGYQNPFNAYIEKIKEISTRPLDDKESGLGLVRIAYEGQSILDFYISEENIIAVYAVYHL